MKNNLELARQFLTQLNLENHPQYKENPIGLLGETALALSRQLSTSSENAITKQQAVPAANHYYELGRGVGMLKSGQLLLASQDKGITFELGALSLPRTGFVNLLVTSGDLPDDPRDKYKDGTLRIHMKEKQLHIGRPQDRFWFLTVEIEPGNYEVQVRAYEEPGGANPDIVLCLRAKKTLASKVMVVT